MGSISSPWSLVWARVPMDVPGNELRLEKTRSEFSLRMKYMRNIADSTSWPVPFIFFVFCLFLIFICFAEIIIGLVKKIEKMKWLESKCCMIVFQTIFYWLFNSLFKIQSNFYRFKFKLASRLLFCSFFFFLWNDR